MFYKFNITKTVVFICAGWLFTLPLTVKAQITTLPLSPVPPQNPQIVYVSQQPLMAIDPRIRKVFEEAKKEIVKLDEQIRKNPLDGTAFYKRGIARSNAGMKEAAIKDFTRALELVGDHAGSYYYRGRTNYYEQEYEKALADLNKSIQLKNDYAESYVMRGLTLQELDQDKEAFRDFTRAIELDPKNAKAYEWRSMLYDDAHEAEANADYRKYLELTDEP